MNKKANLSIKFNGPSIRKNELSIYDIGNIFITLQRIMSELSTNVFEVTPYKFEEITGLKKKRSFGIQQILQLDYDSSKKGSLIFDLLVGGCEIFRNIQSNPAFLSFITSVLANFFCSLIKNFNEPENRVQELKSFNTLPNNEVSKLAHKVIPHLTKFANTIDRNKGISKIDFAANVTETNFSFNFSLHKDNRNEIFKNIGENVAKIQVIHGFLGELSIFTRKGKIKSITTNAILDIEVPKPEICKKLTKYFGKEVKLSVHAEVFRGLIDRKLMTKYIVHNFQE